MLKPSLWIVFVLLMGASVLAQTTECPEFIYDYIAQTAEECAQTGRNEVCYGSTSIDVQARGADSFSFAQPGDITALENIESIQTGGLDTLNQDFGIALMQVQADVVGSLPGQVITFLLMGNISLDGVNDGDAPMQAFRFRTGIGAPTCENSNYDALMIDSPDGLVINFNVNGVDIELGSTAIIVGKPDNKIDMLVIEGQGRVTAMGETVIVDEGFWTQIPMDAETGTQAAGAPEEPVPFGAGRIVHLPFDVLHAGQNLALGKPVTADASLESDPASNVVNGITTGTDNWNAGSEAPHSIEIDLLHEYTVGSIHLQTSQYPATQLDHTVHQLYVADESGNYERVHTFDGETQDDEWLAFEPEIPLLFVRYVKVETTESPHWTSWGEIEVYGASFYGCVVSAASSEEQHWNLFDGAGTNHNSIGSFNTGDRQIAVGQGFDSAGGRWWQLANGAWLNGDERVIGRGSCTFLPIVED